MTAPLPVPGQMPEKGLVHQVRNLLAVIQTQVEVARLIGTDEAARNALHLIERCGQETQQLLVQTERDPEN